MYPNGWPNFIIGIFVSLPTASKISHQRWAPERLTMPFDVRLTCGRAWLLYALRPFPSTPWRPADVTWTSPSSSLQAFTATAHLSTGRVVSWLTPTSQARALEGTRISTQTSLGPWGTPTTMVRTGRSCAVVTGNKAGMGMKRWSRRSDESKQRKQQLSEEMDKKWWRADPGNTDGLAGGHYDRDGFAGQSVRDAQPKRKEHSDVFDVAVLCKDASPLLSGI